MSEKNASVDQLRHASKRREPSVVQMRKVTPRGEGKKEEAASYGGKRRRRAPRRTCGGPLRALAAEENWGAGAAARVEKTGR